MIGLTRVVLGLVAVSFWTAVGWDGPVSGPGTISGNVADYNAADVRLANGVLTVPANVAVYTAHSTIAIGSSFIVTLPSGFTFGSPSLGTSGTATFNLTSGGNGERSATFTVATANVTSGQTIFLNSFTVQGATALETVTPVADALPITMQALGVDLTPLSFPAFASAQGATAVFVGAIQFIDINPPSNATKFFGSPDTLTAVISAAAVQAQTVDAVNNRVPVLGSNGLTNTISSADKATFTIAGNFRGVALPFASTTSDCLNPIGNGSASLTSITIPNVPVDREIFFCVTGSGDVLGNEPNGFATVTVGPGSSTDFLSAPVTIEYPGQICYAMGNACDASYVPPPLAIGTPALSVWALIGLAGLILLFGAWKLKGIAAAA
ncbi:MAG: hypothetical protein ABSH09_19920 [Bryobacteraceae bacterium]|jgi:hypothetical protein